MTALGLELRRGAGPSLFPLLVALGVAGCWRTVAVAPAIWPLVVSSLGTAVMLMGSVAGGVAAFAAARSHRRRTSYLEACSSRGPAAAGLVELAALLGWTASAYVAVVTLIFGYAATTATWSHPDVLRTSAAGLGLLLQVVLGYLAGRLVPRRFTPLVVAFLLYGSITYALGSGSGGRFSQFAPVDLDIYDQFNVLNDRVAPGQLLWYFGVGLALIAGWAWYQQRTPRPAGAAALGLLLAAFGAVVLLPQNGSAIVGGLVAVEWTCTTYPVVDTMSAQVDVCVHPALSSVKAKVTPRLLPVAERLAGTPFRVTRFEQRPRGIGSAPSPGAISFALDDGRAVSFDLLRPATAVNSLGMGDACFERDGGEPYAQLVAAWVAGQPGLFVPFDDDQRRAQRSFQALDDDQTRVWLARHEPAIRACALTPEDFA